LSLVSDTLRLLSGALAAVSALYFIDLPFNLNVLLAILVSIAICDQWALRKSPQQALQTEHPKDET